MQIHETRETVTAATWEEGKCRVEYCYFPFVNLKRVHVATEGVNDESLCVSEVRRHII